MIETLSPSSLATFAQCPQKFKFAKIDQLPDPPGREALRGQIVHDALRRLYSNHRPSSRTREAAQNELEAALDDSEWSNFHIPLTLDDRIQCEALVDNYFEMENPNEVTPVGLEMHVARKDGLHGFIDRLDNVKGALNVVDYKTGKYPRPVYRAQALDQLLTYAVLVEDVIGQRPAMVRLLYLKDKKCVFAVCSPEQMMERRDALAQGFAAIGAAEVLDDFEPNPGPLCGWCNYKQVCPAWC